jgi:hypothetical protein
MRGYYYLDIDVKYPIMTEDTAGEPRNYLFYT